MMITAYSGRSIAFQRCQDFHHDVTSFWLLHLGFMIVCCPSFNRFMESPLEAADGSARNKLRLILDDTRISGL